jgi:hypothetical protein
MEATASSKLQPLSELNQDPEVRNGIPCQRENDEAMAEIHESGVSGYLGFLANKAYAEHPILTGKPADIARLVESETSNTSGETERYSLMPWAEQISRGSYPDWFKYYAWESVTKLSEHRFETEQFQTRSHDATVPYPELNPEALSQLYGWIHKSRVGEVMCNDEGEIELDEEGKPKLDFSVTDVFSDETQETQFQTALEEGSFAKLYAYARNIQTDLYSQRRRKQAPPRIHFNDGTQQSARPSIRIGGNTGNFISSLGATMMLSSIKRTGRENPDTPLTGRHLRFLYGLDGETQSRDINAQIAELRESRSALDMPELTSLLAERTQLQLETASEAYMGIVEQLGGTPVSTEVISLLFSQKIAEWRANGMYEYLAKHGLHFSLVITPNVSASEEQVRTIAQGFRTERRYVSFIVPLGSSDHADRELPTHQSSRPGTNPINFTLVANRFDSTISNRPIARQKLLLSERQAQYQQLDIRIPSSLEAVTFWSTLRTAMSDFDTTNVYAHTFIHHFNSTPNDTSPIKSFFIRDHNEPNARFSVGSAEVRLAVS